MKLRIFRQEDAGSIAEWIKNEREFRLWSADRFGKYPVTPVKIAMHYEECGKSGSFFPLTAVDDYDNVLGHLILRYTDEARTEVRFGFVIIKSGHRGRGAGKEMLELAKKYAVDELHAKRLSLGVFEENKAARKCYEAVGFAETGKGEELYHVLGETWRCIEMELPLT